VTKRIKGDIPAGYQIHITSWENDGDHYATQILSGLSEEDVCFYAELLPLFVSQSRGGFSNRDNVLMESVIEAIEKVLANHPKISNKLRKQFIDSSPTEHDVIVETMRELLGYSEYYTFRVFSDMKVFYYQTPVKEVTAQFKK